MRPKACIITFFHGVLIKRRVKKASFNILPSHVITYRFPEGLYFPRYSEEKKRPGG